MVKALFIAPSHQQAAYWAVQWGYKGNEWIYCHTEDNWRQKVQAFFFPDMPAYVVGSSDPTTELWRDLKARGFEIYNGEDIH